MSDDYTVMLNLTEEEYARAELVAHLVSAYGFFGEESTEEVIKRIFITGLVAAEYSVLGGSDYGCEGSVQSAMLTFLGKDLPVPPQELVAKYKKNPP
jgi:hypothetical protein